MKRFWSMACVAAGVVVAGCGVPSYNERMNETLKRLKYEQAINTYLETPVEGKFKDLGVYFRPPKRLVESAPAWTLPPGSFDQAATFIGSPEPAKVAEGAAAPPALPPLKMHVLARQKPRKVATKKGEAAPPPDGATLNRGDFVGDVRVVMASDYGAEAANEKRPQAEPIGEANFKSLKFVAANSGDDIRVYFARDDKTETDVAIIVDVPAKLRTDPIVTKGVDYALRSFAIGAAARNRFNGNAQGAAGPSGPGAKPEGEAPKF
jgi:hypothetical protein